MTIRPVLLITGLLALNLTTHNAAAHPPEDMPWEAKRNSEYTPEKTEDSVIAPKHEPAPRLAEDIMHGSIDSGATLPKAITSKPIGVIETEEVKKKGWFRRWKEKREARIATKRKPENPKN